MIDSVRLRPVVTIAAATLRVGLREWTVLWLALLFIGMVAVSAWLGGSATHLIGQIYAEAVMVFQREGRAVPPNPVGEMAPLATLRNMTTYVSLLGAMVVMVLGSQLVAQDRRSGVCPLIVSRPLRGADYAAGKMAALLLAIAGLLALAALLNAITLLLLPGALLSAAEWTALLAFYGVSALFLAAFGLLAMASAAWSRSEAMGLLMPVTVWLVLTFVLPQLGANINPMAALNPIKALVAPPSGAFFDIAGPLLAPVSLTSNYRDVAAGLLGFAPADAASLGTGGAIAALVVTDLLTGAAAWWALRQMDATRSDDDA